MSTNSEANKCPTTRPPSAPALEAATELLRFGSLSSAEQRSFPRSLAPAPLASTSLLVPPSTSFANTAFISEAADEDAVATPFQNETLCSIIAAAAARQPMLASFSSNPAMLNDYAKAAATASLHPMMLSAPSVLATASSTVPFLASMPMVAAPWAAISDNREPDQLSMDCTANGKLRASPPPARRPCINMPVDHSYIDYASVSDAELHQLDQDSSILSSPTLSPEKRQLMEALMEMPSKAGGTTMAFPSKASLQQMTTNSVLLQQEQLTARI
jgi:hypothetical protein